MEKFQLKNTVVIIISLIIILFACSKNSQSNSGDGNGSVQGIITDLNNSPLSNVTVTGGTATATTDASGQFTLSAVQFNRDTIVITAAKGGFFERSQKYIADDHTVSNAIFQLIPKTVSGTIAASSGGTIAIQGGGSIDLNPGFVTASDGKNYTGSVSVSTYRIDPSDAIFSAFASGDFRAAGANNPQGSRQSFGLVMVEMNDASGNKLQLASGNNATITLPTALQGKAPSLVPLWNFDAVKGTWKQEGIAEKSNGNYISTVSHFSSWNPANVVDSGQYIRLTLNGTNYSWSPSDSDGIHAEYMDFDTITGITGGSAVYNYYFKGQIMNHNTISAGNYPFVLKLLINGGVFYGTDKNDVRNQAIVTEYGPVGGYITGSASGWFGSLPFTCTYKLIRTQ